MSDPYQIAAWRFEQIAPLIDASLSEAQRRAAWRRRTRTAVEWPGGEARRRRGCKPVKKPIPKSTLYRWIEAFREHGYVGLLPKPRADRGEPRRKEAALWIGYAIGLLYEQPARSLTQLEVYLALEFEDYQLSRTSLDRHLHAHPAFAGIEKLRKGRKSKLRSLYEAQRAHEGWQLDGKGPFPVNLQRLGRVNVHVLTILDDYSRYALGVVVVCAESTQGAIRVFEKTAAKWGLADRFQFDRGSAFESKAFRHGLAQLGVHRNAVKPRQPESQGKVEAYHRTLIRWFVNELAAQEVLDREHLEQLLEAMVALFYNRHHHRTIETTPEKRLANRLAPRQVSEHDLRHAFLVRTTAKSHPKTGEVKLPTARFRVPSSLAGLRATFLYHPVHLECAFVLTKDEREVALEPFTVKPLSAVSPQVTPAATGQLQKLLDRWHGHQRPNAQPGFGLPEVFRELGHLLGRLVPESQHEARSVLAFYRQHGPLPREAFLAACTRTQHALGEGRPLAAYLDDLARQIAAHNRQPTPSGHSGDDL
jgi:transposase InsO family protein